MKRIQCITAIWLLLLIFASKVYSAEVSVHDEQISERLRETVHLYFESSKSFQTGDLVTRSQFQELQAYLRKTAGHSAATHPRLLARTLPDHARMVKYFNHGKNSSLLREAAQKLGGYSALDRLARSITGRQQLEAFLSSGDHLALDTAIKKNTKSTKKSSQKRFRPIYTVEDYLAAVIGPPKQPKSTSKNAETATKID